LLATVSDHKRSGIGYLLSGAEVLPDRYREREDTLSDADRDSAHGPSAVLFQVKLAFEGIVDRFGQLPDLFQPRLAWALGLVLPRGAQQGDAGFGQ
jgi:hypothetical protein